MRRQRSRRLSTSPGLAGAACALALGLLLGCGAPRPAAARAAAAPRRGAAPAQGDDRLVVLDALAQELARNQARLVLPDYPRPYFLSYQLVERTRHQLAGRFGALQTDVGSTVRLAYVDVRVGDHTFDSGGVDGTDYERYVAYAPEDHVTLDDSPDAIRGALWLLSEARYKAAITSYLKKKAQRVYAASDERSKAFAPADQVVHIEPRVDISLDLPSWRERVRTMSARLRAQPEVFDALVRLSLIHERRWQVTSEGSRIITERPIVSLQVTAYARADDGMLVEGTRSYYGHSPDELPTAQRLLADADAVVKELRALRAADVLEPYVGPAILESEAAGVLFHEAIGHRLEGHRQKDDTEGQTFKGRLGQRILPEFISVHDDPTRIRWEGQSLNGHYRVDDEAVEAEDVTLVDAGVLRGFLMGRAPIEGFERSNGHGRAQVGFAPVGRMGNLIISSSSVVTRAQLKQRLLQEVRRQGKPHGLIVGEITGGATNTSSFGFQAFKGRSRMVWRVDASTGAETLVRGVEVVGTPLASIAKILVTSDQRSVFNGYCGAESGAVPVSVVAPALLVEELELQRSTRDEDSGPVLPAPWNEPAAAPSSRGVPPSPPAPPSAPAGG